MYRFRDSGRSPAWPTSLASRSFLPVTITLTGADAPRSGMNVVSAPAATGLPHLRVEYSTLAARNPREVKEGHLAMDGTDVMTEARGLVARIRAGNTAQADLELAANLLEKLTSADEATVTFTLTRTEAAALTARSAEVLAEFRKVVADMRAG